MAGGVVEAFTELDLLPDLLGMARSAGDAGAALAQWADFLDGIDANADQALGDWLEKGWSASGGGSIVHLLQDAADLLAEGRETFKALPGLLAVEAESIIARCLQGRAEAEALVGALPEHRGAALAGVQMNAGSARSVIVLADFVCERHMLAVNPDSPVGLTELRASLILAVHCGWLSHADPWSPVDQFVAGPRA